MRWIEKWIERSDADVRVFGAKAKNAFGGVVVGAKIRDTKVVNSVPDKLDEG